MIIGKSDTLGRVQEGYTADLLLVGKNPLDTPRNLDAVELVLLGGQPVTLEWMCNLQ